jgi:hypothetical protein
MEGTDAQNHAYRLDGQNEEHDLNTAAPSAPSVSSVVPNRPRRHFSEGSDRSMRTTLRLELALAVAAFRSN